MALYRNLTHWRSSQYLCHSCPQLTKKETTPAVISCRLRPYPRGLCDTLLWLLVQRNGYSGSSVLKCGLRKEEEVDGRIQVLLSEFLCSRLKRRIRIRTSTLCPRIRINIELSRQRTERPKESSCSQTNGIEKSSWWSSKWKRNSFLISTSSVLL